MKCKSKLFGVLISLWVVLGMAFPTFAAYTLSLEAKDGKTQFKPGEDLYLNIILSDADGVAGCAFTLNYDTNAVDPPPTNAEGLPVNSGDITSIFPFMQDSTPTHRENSGEAGKIYFAGAEIAGDGGAKYGPGAITLFTVKFKVKTDALPGDFSFSLTQTELFNPAAGYGTDANSNGVYDPGTDDTKGKVPVLVGALDMNDQNFGGDLSDDFPILLGDQPGNLATLQLSVQQMVSCGDELAIDFGNLGIWHYHDGAWDKISDVGAECMMSFNGSFLGDFGGQGVWRFDGTAWQQFSGADPVNTGKAMMGFNNGVVINFGGVGLWFTTDGIAWQKLSDASPRFMATYGNYAVFDFGSLGVWRYEATSPTPTWIQLSGADPDNSNDAFIAFGNGIIIDFGNLGLWFTVDGVAWDNISSANPEFMTTYGNYAVFDFGSLGVWRYEATSPTPTWIQLSGADPDNNGDTMMAFQDGVIIDFGGLGLWFTVDGVTWDNISGAKPESMAVYGNFAVFDFGSLGVWQYDGAGWFFVSDANPDNIGNALCDINLLN